MCLKELVVVVVVVVNLTTEDHPDVLTGKADMLPAATKQKGQLKAGGKTKKEKPVLHVA